MSTESLSTKIYRGQNDLDFEVINYAVNKNSTLVKRSKEYEWETDDQRITLESALDSEDSVAAFKIRNLIEVLTTIRDELDSEEVKVRLSEDRPITFVSKDSERKLLGTVAPMRSESGPASRLHPVEANLLRYHVYCDEWSTCDWAHDRYRSKDDAIEAARDHKYFTGHECSINDYEGNEVEITESNKTLKSSKGDQDE